MTDPTKLSRRERQIMDVLYARGRATAAEVQEDLPDAPSYSAVRALLAKMERKGQVRHQKAGQRYVYQPLLEPAKARRSALDRLVHTFFGGSAARAATSLLGRSAESMSDQELAELEAIVRQARQRNEPQSAEAGDRGPGAEEADASAAARGPSSGGER